MSEEIFMLIESLVEKFPSQVLGLGLFKLLINMVTTAQVNGKLSLKILCFKSR